MNHAFTQIPQSVSSSSQTVYNRQVNKATSYDIVIPSNYDEQELLDTLKRVAPLLEGALQDNAVVDIFVDYLDIPEKGDTSIFRRAEEDEAVKALGNYADLKLGDNLEVHCMDVHPIEKDMIAVSLCQARLASESKGISSFGKSSPAFIVGWKLGNQTPEFYLRSPEDCFVFHFNPSQPHLIVAGCRNGTVALWDTSKVNKCRRGETKSAIEPILKSNPEHGPKRTVGDLCWLPPHIHINAQGQILHQDFVSKTSFQFFTVSGDGQIYFWDVRFLEIIQGKLPHIAKVKQSSKQGFDTDDDFPVAKWLPLFKIKPKRLQGSGEISFCRAFFLNIENELKFKRSQIVVSSEEGDLLSVDWCPKSEGDTESQDYVQWLKKDHNRPCLNLSQSPFFPDFVLSVSDWNFHLWHVTEGLLIFSSPMAESSITGGIWSPTRPGVIYVTTVDGSIEIWDFMTEGCYAPHKTMPLIPSSITAVDFTSSASSSQILVVGDERGVLHMFELPAHFVHPYPHEQDYMQKFLTREVNCHSMLVERSNEKSKKKCTITIEETNCLTEEEEIIFLELERDFLS
jgi:WD40 repeat protein